MPSSLERPPYQTRYVININTCFADFRQDTECVVNSLPVATSATPLLAARSMCVARCQTDQALHDGSRRQQDLIIQSITRRLPVPAAARNGVLR